MLDDPPVLYANNMPLDNAGHTPLTEWQEVIFTCLPPSGVDLMLALALGSASTPQTIPLQAYLLPNDPTWRWRWNPQNKLGHQTFLLTLQYLSLLPLPTDVTKTYRFSCTVVPYKLDQHHYTRLLDDLNRTFATLPYTPKGASMAGAAHTPAAREHETHNRTPHILETAYSFFDEQLTRLERVVKRIAQHPHTRLSPTTTRLPTERGYDFSLLSRDLSLPPAPPTSSVSSTSSVPSAPLGTDPQTPCYPAEITHPTTIATPDTYENRLLKHLLYRLWQRATTLAALAQHSPTTAHLTPHAHTAAHRLQQLLRLPFLVETQRLTNQHHGATHILRHHPDYRQIYRLWQQFRALPDLAPLTPTFHIPIHDLPRLYEYWCHLQLARALVALKGGTVRYAQLLAPPVSPAPSPTPNATLDHNLDLTLYTPRFCEHRPSLVVVWQGKTLTLRYHPRYSPPHHPSAASAHVASPTFVSLDPHTHIPDSVVEIAYNHNDADKPSMVLVVDAKYRLTASGTIPQAALADAYTYLGSIGHVTGEPCVQGVALCYPAATAPANYQSRVSVLPMLPDHPNSIATWLYTHLAML